MAANGMVIVDVVAPVGISEPLDSSDRSGLQLPVASSLEVADSTLGLFPMWTAGNYRY